MYIYIYTEAHTTRFWKKHYTFSSMQCSALRQMMLSNEFWMKTIRANAALHKLTRSKHTYLYTYAYILGQVFFTIYAANSNHTYRPTRGLDNEESAWRAKKVCVARRTKLQFLIYVLHLFSGAAEHIFQTTHVSRATCGANIDLM